MKLSTSKRSVLSASAQREVDQAIMDYGAMGIGYYHMLTQCANCHFEGHTLFPLGEKTNYPNTICVKCGGSNTLFLRDRR